MKTLYLECGMGAAGDMLMAALLELIPEREAFVARMNALGLPGVEITAEPAEKCGIRGTHMRVTVRGEEELSEDEHGHHHHEDEDRHHHHHHDEDEHGHHHHHHDEDEHGHHHHHHHMHMADIEAVIGGLDIPEKVKGHALAVYREIAAAESQVHGRSVEEIHFHEVGMMDAVADVVGVCLLMDEIGAERITASPVHVGSGYVRCMHGVLPVPAPATALLLTGIPTYGGAIEGELCTPTGAALLKHFVDSFGDRPVLAVQKIGYGMGQKDFPRANCVRAFLGEAAGQLEEITRLECNLDDMTGEEIGFAMEQLFGAGARDVYTQPIGMKKNRPGILLSCICLRADADRLAEGMLRHTTSLGIRRQDMGRYVLSRQVEETDGVRVKRAEGFGVQRRKAEYEDLAALARARGCSLMEAREAFLREHP